MLTRIARLTVGLVLLAFGSASAQGDAVKKLVGTWEGEIDFAGLPGDPGRDPRRTLVVESVTERDGKWVAAARFGFTGKTLGRVNADVDPAGARPSLAFSIPAGMRIRLQLTSDKQLEGTFQVPGATARGNERPMKLTRKE